MRLCSMLELTEFPLTEHEKWAKADSKLMALLMVSCKLAFDLDNTPAWIDWANATEEEHGKDKHIGKDDIIENDILEMSDDKLDEYMDWMQSTWLDDTQSSRTLYPAINSRKSNPAGDIRDVSVEGNARSPCC
jgi:hypothetical protein